MGYITKAAFKHLCENAFNSTYAQFWNPEREARLAVAMGAPVQYIRKTKASSVQRLVTDPDRNKCVYEVLKSLEVSAATSIEIAEAHGISRPLTKEILMQLKLQDGAVSIRISGTTYWARGHLWQEALLIWVLK